MTHRRWLIVGLMFAVTFAAYMDRVNFSVSIPAIRHATHFSLEQIGLVSSAWALAYAIFNLPGGWLADRIGLRWGTAAALAWWSIFTIASPFATSLAGWITLRALMGAGEAPIWSCNAKIADEWVAADERARAYAWGGAGEFLGPAAGALAAGAIATTLGWRASFVIFGVLGMLLVPIWIILVRNRPDQDQAVNPAEQRHIGHQGQTTPPGPDWPGLRAVAFSRVGLGLLITYITSGYVLFTFKTWLPTYMHAQFHATLMGGALWASLGSALGFVGFVLAGPVNDALTRRMDRLTARRLGTAIPGAIAILCLLLSVLTARARLAWPTATLIGLAQLLTTITAGAWAVTVIDLSPGRGSTGLLYGYFNGALNLAGAANGIAIGAIATHLGFPAAFASTIVFLAVFILGMTVVVDRPGYQRLWRHARQARGETLTPPDQPDRG